MTKIDSFEKFCRIKWKIFCTNFVSIIFETLCMFFVKNPNDYLINKSSVDNLDTVDNNLVQKIDFTSL